MSNADNHSANTDIEPVWHLSVAYDGTNFHGWQVQSQKRTVQDEIEKRLRLLFNQPDLRILGASRTDAGVHALDQQLSFRLKRDIEMTPEEMRYRLNRWLPDDIKVTGARRRPAAFHARHSISGKAYIYVLYSGEKAHPFYCRYLWHLQRDFDLAAMQTAAAYLEGEHDYSSFAANPKRHVPSHVRHLYRVEVCADGDYIFFVVAGNSFLYKMVRGIVGYLAAVGLAKADPHGTPAVLLAKDRDAAAESAPPQGLFLAKSFMHDDEWQKYEPLLPPFAWQNQR